MSVKGAQGGLALWTRFRAGCWVVLRMNTLELQLFGCTPRKYNDRRKGKNARGHEKLPMPRSMLSLLGLWALITLLSAQAAEPFSREREWERLLAASDPAVFTRASPEFLMEWGSRYENGVGVGRDYARARQLYCAAARRGHAPAQVRLAWMYAHGLGAARDRELAGAWLRVAAAQGDLEARKLLAVLGYPPRGKQPHCTYAHREEQSLRARP